jgi:hypothetical protein
MARRGNNVKRRRFALLFTMTAVVLVVALSGGTATARDGDHRGRGNRLDARLNGANEVPAADPDGDGRARFELDAANSRICFRVQFDDTGTPFRGHIHRGVAGANGGIVVTMFELGQAAPNLGNPIAANPADPRFEPLEEGGLRECVPADPAIIAEIAANPAGFYCNLHNPRFPGGAIRGQLKR